MKSQNMAFSRTYILLQVRAQITSCSRNASPLLPFLNQAVQTSGEKQQAQGLNYFWCDWSARKGFTCQEIWRLKKKNLHQISLTPESYRQVKQNKTKKLLKGKKLLSFKRNKSPLMALRQCRAALRVSHLNWLLSCKCLIYIPCLIGPWKDSLEATEDLPFTCLKNYLQK